MAKGDSFTSGPIKKQDKVIRPSEMPGPQEPSGWQFPPRPGYDVIDGRGPGEIKEVGDMDDAIYPGGLSAADIDSDLSPGATNSLGKPDGSTHSDPTGVNPISIQRPPNPEKYAGGENTPEVVDSVPMTGCGSDGMMDRFPESRRGKHDNLPSDEE